MNESTDGRSELNSTGGSFMPDITKIKDDESWINKTYNARPSRGLETFSLAKQVEDTEDDSELLSLQKTMLTFIEDDNGEPSDAETLSSTSSDSGEKSDILSDKSDSGDETFQDSRSEELLNDRNWASVDAENLWQDRNDSNFTLVPSPSRANRTNPDLNCGVWSSDGVKWNNSNSKENGKTQKWNDPLKRNVNRKLYSATYGTENFIKQQHATRKLTKSFVDQALSRRNCPDLPERINDVIQSHCKPYVDRTTGKTILKNDAGDTEFSPRHTDITVPRNNVFHLSDGLQSHDEENVLRNGMTNPNISCESNAHTPSTHRNFQKKSFSNHSNASGRKNIPSCYNSGVTKSPRDLVSKSVPCKPTIQNLRDLPEGGLSGSQMYKDPLSSLEKVYRWLSPSKDTLNTQRHRVSARRRLHLITSNSDVMRWEDQPAVKSDGKRPEEFYADDETDGMDHVTLMGAPDSTNLTFKQTAALLSRADLNLNRMEKNFSPQKNQSQSFGRIKSYWENPNKTPKQLNDKSSWKSPKRGKIAENSYDVNSNKMGSPVDTKVPLSGYQFLTPKHSNSGVLNGNMSPQGGLNRTPKQNNTLSNTVDSPSQTHNSSLPILNGSPWRSQSCGQRFHPYSRKNPDSPSAIFARLKLGLPSPSADRFDPTKRIQFTEEIHKAIKTTKPRLCDKMDSNHSAEMGRYEDLVLFDKNQDLYRDDQKLCRKRPAHEPMEILPCMTQLSARGEAKDTVEQLQCMDTEMKRSKRFEKYRKETPGDLKSVYRTKEGQNNRGTSENFCGLSDKLSGRSKTSGDHDSRARGHSYHYLECKTRTESKFDWHGEHTLSPGSRNVKKKSGTNPCPVLLTQNTIDDQKCSNLDRKLDPTSAKFGYNNQQQISTTISKSPLVKISSKPKVISPSTTSKSSNTQRTPMVKLQQLNSFSERTNAFKQPKGYTISLQDKILVNTQTCRNSTPKKFTVPFTLNNTLSTINGQNSGSESSEDDVVTISPSR